MNRERSILAHARDLLEKPVRGAVPGCDPSADGRNTSPDDADMQHIGSPPSGRGRCPELRRKPREMPVVLAAVSCVVLSSCSTLSTFRNPRVEVPVEHPPGIGFNVREVAFAPPGGPCSNAIVGGLTQTLLSRGVEVSTDITVVAGRENLRGGVQGDGSVGETAGDSLLVTVSDTACDSENSFGSRREERTRTRTRTVDGEEEEYEEKYTVTVYTAGTRFNLGVSVRAADLDTGRVLASTFVQRSRVDTNTGTDEVPGFPSEAPLRRGAAAAAELEIEHWLLPWTERVSLVFYDAEECGMMGAYAYLLRGDPVLAAEATQSGIAACEDPDTDARFRAAAYYNAGILSFIGGEHDTALGMLGTALFNDPGNAVIAEAAGHVRRARDLLEEIRRIEGLEPEAP